MSDRFGDPLLSSFIRLLLNELIFSTRKRTSVNNLFFNNRRLRKTNCGRNESNDEQKTVTYFGTEQTSHRAKTEQTSLSEDRLKRLLCRKIFSILGKASFSSGVILKVNRTRCGVISVVTSFAQ